MDILENEPMSKHTSLKVGGFARFFLKVDSPAEISQALKFIKEKNTPYFLLGNGTNLLVSDKGFNGAIIQLGRGFSDISDSFCTLNVGAGVSLGRLSRATVNKSLVGMHKLCGIPGTVGGAIYMNAGAYGQEISQCCTQVKSLTFDGELKIRTKEECKFSYRHSIFQDLAKENVPEIIISAEFNLTPAKSSSERSDMEAEMQELMKKRAASQPLNKPNAGSTFKRLTKGALSSPEQVAPGYYIEQAGLKGFRIGGAEVSQVHANFIVNTGNATAQDIKDLSEHMQESVEKKFGIKLQREIIFLGEF